MKGFSLIITASLLLCTFFTTTFQNAESPVGFKSKWKKVSSYKVNPSKVDEYKKVIKKVKGARMAGSKIVAKPGFNLFENIDNLLIMPDNQDEDIPHTVLEQTVGPDILHIDPKFVISFRCICNVEGNCITANVDGQIECLDQSCGECLGKWFFRDLENDGPPRTGTF